ncbi:MAG: lysozyme inhibitor LprI family protein [Alphaproteobacteria bacterium]
MRPQTFFAALVPLFLVGAAAIAGPVEECSVQSGSQVEIGNCLVPVAEAADLVMAQALEFATADARETDAATGRAVAVPALEAAQQAWLAFRDQHCDYVGATFGGGSGTGIAIQGCRIEMARARADALMRFVH